MITSIFSKSRPINFIIVFFIVLIAFITARIELIKGTITMVFVFKQLVLFGVCYASILLLNFIVSKNNLSNKNNYEILLFSLFLLAITSSTSHVNVIFSNFFVMLGLRRIISLRSQINVKKKLFDAAFWIAIAALFYFWAILFFVIILISLLLYSETKINHWIIPFTGVITVFLITIGASIILNDNFFELFKSFPEVSYDLSSYNSTQYLVAITLLLSFGIWSSLFYIKSIKQKKKAFRASFNTILFAGVIALVIIILAPKKDGSEFLFAFAPLSIIITNYIEIIEEKWFKEVFLSVLILVPFILLFL
ncbi:DUF6427 family protein [Thalassobellus suaedae]|uniref:DUF6427 family protein n=1 Tax=Thalassobellus suaedae TaxID=3074124 RepID=A0ABY9XS30_9FLAO|nr:DUF6427 family protein [Flavobacteriaceae bacterium HL-DH14]